MFSLAHRSSSFFKYLFDLKDGQLNPYMQVSEDELCFDRKYLEQLNFERIQSIVQHAALKSIHYKNIFADYGVTSSEIKTLDDLKRLPLLTRDHLKNDLELVTITGDRSGWVKSATGGTTSSPVSYYRDQPSSLRRAADTSVIDSWFGRRLGDRVAYLWGAAQDFSDKPTIGMRLRNMTYQKVLMLPSIPLDRNILRHYVERLDQWRPSFLQSYPTPLYELCLYLKAVGKRLPYLNNVAVTAEPLHSYQRDLIEEVLGFKVFNWYGSRELGRVAFECECHDGLHINEPSKFVEIEPDPALPDGYGYLVITDLWNKATPFIRYMTGDIAKKVDGPCKCGRALSRITAIEGRVADLIILSDGRKIPGVALSGRIIKDFSEITEYQIIQKTCDVFLIRFVKGPEFNNDSLTKFESSFSSFVDANVDLLFEECSSIERSLSGKMRTVISEVGNI